MVKVRVDRELCIGDGICVDVAPEVFALDDEGIAVVIDAEAGDDDLLREAADSCPVEAIILLDDGSNQLHT